MNRRLLVFGSKPIVRTIINKFNMRKLKPVTSEARDSSRFNSLKSTEKLAKFSPKKITKISSLFDETFQWNWI